MSSINTAALLNSLNSTLNTFNNQSALTNTANATATPDLSAMYSNMAAVGTNNTTDAYTNSTATTAATTQPNLGQIMTLMVEMLQAIIGTLAPGNPTASNPQNSPTPTPDPRQQAFNRMDTNGDGVISRAEFQNAAPPKHAHKHHGTNANLQAMLAKADTNGDGTISQDEFNAFQPTAPNGQALPTPTAAMKQAMFARLDQNRDGSISQTEIQNAPPPPFFQNNNNGFLNN